MINDSSLNDEHLWGNLLWNHTLHENKAECIRKNKIKASSSGRKYMTASILRAAEQISTTATGRLNNGGLRGRLHLRLNDTKAINLYSSGAFSSALWCYEIYLAFLSFGKNTKSALLPNILTHQCTAALISEKTTQNQTDDMDRECTFPISSVY